MSLFVKTILVNVVLVIRGLNTLNKAAIDKDDGCFKLIENVTVHPNCRQTYTNKRYIEIY